MKTTYIVTFLSPIILLTSSAQAYKYTFENISDKDAVVQFQLMADLGDRLNTLPVKARSSAVMDISEWNRAGLCIDPQSIKIKFLSGENSGKFKQPFGLGSTDDIRNKYWSIFNVDSIHKLVGSVKGDDVEKILAADNGITDYGEMGSCGDKYLYFTYVTKNTYPIIQALTK